MLLPSLGSECRAERQNGQTFLMPSYALDPERYAKAPGQQLVLPLSDCKASTSKTIGMSQSPITLHSNLFCDKDLIDRTVTLRP